MSKYTASDGSLWHVELDPPPVPTRSWWWWVSDDYDGALDAHDLRIGNAPTREAAEAAIEEWIEEEG